MSRRVLVVDDSPEICELLQAVLYSAGMDALGLTNSQQAAGHLVREKFDAIFLDIRMPAPDGIELAGRVRSSGFNQKTPIVMISGDADPALQTRAFQAGANFFLYKPLDRRRLMRILRVTQASIQHERRRFQRVNVRCKATVESSNSRVEGWTLDMSLNGMLVQTGAAFPAGTRVAVNVQLKPSTAPLRASGKVARVIGEDCMGIELARVSLEESERLQEFLLPLILASVEEPVAKK
ncbi:MAG: response regulator [Acidobacteria bacterium]|nr:response regulator [Acidobacteriota bacterium]MCL5289364.1 response regulator [Acidobacteriota bacterium]